MKTYPDAVRRDLHALYPIEDPALVDANILQVTWIGSQLGA